jgi:glycosyltransferase involved in cell wall biosynthesis
MTRDMSTPSARDASVFLVETPLQLLNAIEARHYFQIEKAHLRILTSPPFPHAAFAPLLEDGHWASVEHAAIRSTQPHSSPAMLVGKSPLAKVFEYRDYVEQAYRRHLLNRWAQALGAVGHIFLGGYMQPYMKHFANVLPHRRLIALDDGTDTLRVNQGRLLPKPTHSPVGIARVKARAHRLLHDWDTSEAERLTFFTGYDLETRSTDSVIKNEYAYVRSRTPSRTAFRDLMFLGQPLVEDGYLSVDAYVHHIENALAFLRATDVIYVPHPRESADTVERVARTTCVQVERFDVPVELQMACYSGPPRRLASFFCSALDNARLIFGPHVLITAFRIPPNDLLTARTFVQDVYEYFAAHVGESFHVVRLPARAAEDPQHSVETTAHSLALSQRTRPISQPMVSVVIPTYNAAQYLGPTLDSVLAQADVSMEVIVVDDCSTDDTPTLMRRYADRAQYIRLDKNHGGPARPRNVGVRAAAGQCVALLDGDDVMLPGKLAEQYAFLALHADIPFVFTNFRDFSDEQPQQPDFLSDHRLFHQMPKEPFGREHFRIRHVDAFETLLGDNFIGTSGVLFLASLAPEIGPFDESLRNSDDLDWWFRLTKAHDIGYIDKVYHMRRRHPGNISSRPSALYARLEVYTRRQPDLSSRRARKHFRETLSDNYFGLGYQQRLAGKRLAPILSYSRSWYYSKRRLHIARSMLAALLQLRPHSPRGLHRN